MDPVSEIWEKLIPDPGVKTAPDPGSGSATLYKTLPKKSAISKKKSRKVFRRLGFSMTGQFSYRTLRQVKDERHPKVLLHIQLE